MQDILNNIHPSVKKYRFKFPLDVPGEVAKIRKHCSEPASAVDQSNHIDFSSHINSHINSQFDLKKTEPSIFTRYDGS
ncbi:hypothetical protein Hanom_Chr10g00961001 [Helianthus anomalus]